MTQTHELAQFNRPGFLAEGWYWLLSSKELKIGKAVGTRFMGQDFALYRGFDGKVRAVEAYCPHMGAHLGDGLVEENSIRCLFHNWKFDSDGTCSQIPTRQSTAGAPCLQTFKVDEKYGMVWLWTGPVDDSESIPEVPELEGLNTSYLLGNSFSKNCHPNVVMINAIDANHFNTVHNLFVPLRMKATEVNARTIRFQNTTTVPASNWIGRLVRPFYKAALTYEMTYWYGHIGCVTLGPDFLHFYIMFALRPAADGTTEGQTILLTRQRSGVSGYLLNKILLQLTKIVGNYFAKGDTIIFSKIKFNLAYPVAADQPVLDFIRHYEKQSEGCLQRKPPAWTAKPRKEILPEVTL